MYCFIGYCMYVSAGQTTPHPPCIVIITRKQETVNSGRGEGTGREG